MTKEKIQTEADALRSILDWSKERPAWQRDALRRLLQNGELTDADIATLADLCKDKSNPSYPLREEHISAQKTGAPTVALKSIRNVQNVNALAEKQTLSFIPKGITIIYGDNGAGKSGYVRLLKRSCRARNARGKEETLLPNIYEQAKGPQFAELEYQAGAQTQKATWKSGQPVDALFSEISVFDSRTANVHVEETNDLAYTPFPMKVLERLVAACKSVKETIDGEIAVIKAQTPRSVSDPSCSPNTAVGQMMAMLGKDTKPEAVETLAALSDEEAARLAELTSDFAHDPKATARRLRAQKTRLETIRTRLHTLKAAASTESAGQLATLSSDLRAKTEAARLASAALFKNEPLEGVGSETWRTLWEAARAYSTADAYPETAFPVTGEEARCVLCQQELSEQAGSRLHRFEAFVQDRTQQDEEAARRALSAFVETLRKAWLSRRTRLEDRRFLAEEFGNQEVAAAYTLFTVRILWRLRAVLRAGADVALSLPTLDDLGLDAVIDALDTRADALLADEEAPERKALRAELAGLQDRQWLTGVKDDVLAEIERAKDVGALNAALKDTKQNTITAKNTELSRALITERLRGRFAQEINHLDLAGLSIELEQAGSQSGISRFKVSLMHKKSENAGSILSEGEYRCVALAGFLAELATNDSESGIIFDDPVSSLDHLHRESIAKRLAEEGRKRQVIVFTHDLPFLFLLRNACVHGDDPALKTEVAVRHIQKRQDTPGFCRNEPPEKAQDARSRLKTMRNHLAKARVQYDNDPDGTDWLMTARGLTDSLRQTWEAAVEDSIAPVLRTFSSKVDTKGFAKLSAITEQHAKTMRQHYGECSILLHKISDAMNPVTPTPDRIEKELDALTVWLDDVSSRQKKI
ncbi:AAA family ATPase [Paracoccus sp. 1_MG-2023]|uniref:AAA family ATPase n=1 Tax=unclassified Paracoccus (in: a-proteobacteria) TaxID=2688777 RepID=UPI001C0A3A46|nr:MULTISPECIES: AAA family ATPase [unclassified Paracoccus (in: a-proteobacteria)]MBU2956788.1 AAA family ATPase [Paracoccus sp. C2R09]MDO6669173.1 AAA family ATPase [Paracoccus sp. 1_MG-2023]